MQFKFHMNYVIEGSGALVNEKGEEQPLKTGDFAFVNPEGLTQENRSACGGELMSAASNPGEKHQYRNKGDQPFRMICGVPKEFE